MPIEIIQADPTHPGRQVQFTFANQIIDYAIGFSAFQITYGADDHWIRSLMIKILPVQGAVVGAQGNQVSAQVQIVMVDDSGSTAKTADSFVVPVCIALTKSPNPNTVIGTASGISSGGTGQRIVVPNEQSGYTISTCFQSGFNLSFTTDDHQLLLANASCGIPPAGPTGTSIVASANLQDLHNSVQVATIDAGYIVSSSPSPGLGSKDVQAQTTAATAVTMDGMKSITAAAAVIRGWQFRFPTVHNVQTIKVGAWGQLGIAGNVVTIPQLFAHISDSSNNTQDDDQSSCDVQVLAVP
jgi:hypothetical protein